MDRILCLKHSNAFEETIKTVAKKCNIEVEINLQEMFNMHYKKDQKDIHKA